MLKVERETSLNTTVRVHLKDAPGRGARVIKYERRLPGGRFSRSKDNEGMTWPYSQVDNECQSWDELVAKYGEE